MTSTTGAHAGTRCVSVYLGVWSAASEFCGVVVSWLCAAPSSSKPAKASRRWWLLGPTEKKGAVTTVAAEAGVIAAAAAAAHVADEGAAAAVLDAAGHAPALGLALGAVAELISSVKMKSRGQACRTQTTTSPRHVAPDTSTTIVLRLTHAGNT